MYESTYVNTALSMYVCTQQPCNFDMSTRGHKVMKQFLTTFLGVARLESSTIIKLIRNMSAAQLFSTPLCNCSKLDFWLTNYGGGEMKSTTRWHNGMIVSKVCERREELWQIEENEMHTSTYTQFLHLKTIF